MTTETRTITEYKLIITEDEKQYIQTLLQNPYMYGMEEEPKDEQKLRQHLFNGLANT